MTAYHATHPSPYDDACPDCAGYDLTESATAATGCWLTAFTVILAACVAALLLRRITR